MAQKRSKGITFVAVIAVLYSLCIFKGSAKFTDAGLFFQIFVGLGWFVAAVAVFKLKKWGRKLLEVIVGLSLGETIGKFFIKFNSIAERTAVVHHVSAQTAKVALLISFFLLSGFYLMILIFLTRPKVKEQFE